MNLNFSLPTISSPNRFHTTGSVLSGWGAEGTRQHSFQLYKAQQRFSVNNRRQQFFQLILSAKLQQNYEYIRLPLWDCFCSVKRTKKEWEKKERTHELAKEKKKEERIAAKWTGKPSRKKIKCNCTGNSFFSWLFCILVNEAGLWEMLLDAPLPPTKSVAQEFVGGTHFLHAQVLNLLF